jgi:hypothetical protein
MTTLTVIGMAVGIRMQGFRCFCSLLPYMDADCSKKRGRKSRTNGGTAPSRLCRYRANGLRVNPALIFARGLRGQVRRVKD